MSMRLQAKLKGKMSSHIEESYMRQKDVVVLEGVDAEMTFKTTQGFIEHESQLHNYLPCFHMIGEITEVRGDFPFSVSSLYFSAVDQPRLIKDIIYYPSPEELAHIIQTGKFYSRHFKVPPILSENTYTLPCKLDMLIVPPTNQALYEANLLSNFEDLEDEDQVNLPIFYIGILGTGVSRRNDRLLDYYGIVQEPGYEHFLLTAESSGYTDPPLMQYMTAPVLEEQAQRVDTDEYYISPEEEREMLHSAAERQQMAEREAASQVSQEVQADFHQATPEDAMLAQADRAVARRMEAKFGDRRMSLDAKREHDRKAAQERAAAAMAPSAKSMAAAEALLGSPKQEAKAPAQPSQGGYDPNMFVDDEPLPKEKQPDVPQQQAEVKMDLDPERNATVDADREERKASGDQELLDQDHAKVSELEGGDVSDAAAQVKVDEAHARDMAQDVAVQKQQELHMDDKSEQAMQGPSDGQSNDVAAQQGADRAPDQSQQQAEVKMDLDPERNAAVEAERDAHGEDVVPKDQSGLEAMAGGDVADAAAQAKVDEAHAMDLARDTALQHQQEAHREAPESMQEIADKYDKGRQDGASRDDEFLA